MQKDETGLQQVFSAALDALRKAQSKPRGDERQTLYLESRKLFEQAGELIDSLDLFSDNESIDSVTTNDIKYLLVPVYLANILLSLESRSYRLKNLARAEELIIDFLRRISHYGLGDAEIEAALDPPEPDKTAINLKGTPMDLNSAMKSRNEKIEKFRRSQRLEAEIEELEKRMKSGQAVDEELMRNYNMMQLKKHIQESLNSLQSEVRPAIYLERNRPQMEESHEGQELVSVPSSNRSAFTIVRNELQKQVFGLGYPSRPTVTVDEFIGQKIEDGSLAFTKDKAIYANSLQRYAEKPNLLREQEENSDIEHEEKEEREDLDELRRKRQWDEFKDDTPRGSGNRHNMG